MRDYQWLHEYCLNRFGSAAALEARLPQPKSPAELAAVSDDRYLSLISLRIFRAGLKHSLVDAKWPAFEEVFFGFDPQKVVLMGGERLENLMQDTRLIRHLGKLKSVPRNAQMILDIAHEHGSFGKLLADWPVTQLGGLSAPRFLRMAGKDTFIPSDDVVAALKAQEIVDKAPTSQKDLAAVQAAFNAWHEQSGRPLCQLSMMLSYTVNH
jgi:3-methyladenine DNA glycosylase Tag